MDVRDALDTMIQTKALRQSQFIEQLDLYRAGHRLALVAGFSGDDETRFAEMVAVVGAFGADEVVHGGEAWVRKFESVDDTDPETVEMLIALRVTQDDVEQASVEFTEVGGVLVFDGAQYLRDSIMGMVVAAIREGLSPRNSQHMADPHLVARAVQHYGMACILG